MSIELTWVLIADGSQAKVLEANDAGRDLLPVEDMTFSAVVPAGRDILADRPGRSFDSFGTGRHSMENPSDPRRQLKRQFADMLALELDKAFSAGRFAHLAIFAAPAALGDLRATLPERVKSTIVAEVGKDLIKVPLGELPRHLENVLRRPVRVHGKRRKPRPEASGS